MADAKITLNLTPAEFDLVRETLTEREQRCSELSKLSHPDRQNMTAEDRRANNALGMRLHDLLSKLR